MSVRKNLLKNRSRHVGAFLSLLLLALASQGRLTAGGLPPDANAIVKKMVLTYKKAASLQDFAEANIVAPGVSPYVQSSRLKYRAPNIVHFHAQDPMSGTVSMHANGSTVTLYNGKQNVFTRRDSPPKLRETIAVADKAAIDAFGSQISQILSPLSFMTSNGMPREARVFRYAGETSLDGHRVHKVTALADLKWMKGMIPNTTITPVKRDITLWIDVKTNLLRKASGFMTWKVTGINGQPLAQPLPGGFRFEETHRDTILNATIPDTEFRFDPPKGAKQLFQERR